MPEVRTPLWKTLTRAGILIGILVMLTALMVLNISDQLKFKSPPVIIPFVAGAALIVGGVLLNLGWFKQGTARRKFLVGLNVWFMVALSVILLVIANAIVARTPQTAGWLLDLGKDKLYTLSPQTKNIVSGLQKEVTITLFTGSEENFPLSRRLSDMLSLYRSQSHNLVFRTVDAYRDKKEVAQAVQRMKGLTDVSGIPDSVVVQSGDKTVHIPFQDMVEQANPFSPEPAAPGFNGEEKITTAILNVTEEKQSGIYFLTGHGERDISGSEQALNKFVVEMKRNNYVVDKLNLQTARQVPENCVLLVIAGPTAPFAENEIKIVKDYLDKNGSLLVLAQPVAQKRGNLKGLDKLLADYNVRVHDDEIVIEVYRDLLSGQQTGGISVYTTDYGNHPITADLKTTNCLLDFACPVEPVTPERASSPYARAPEPKSPYSVTTLLSSSPRSWGETNIVDTPIKFNQGIDEMGPLSLAVAVQRRSAPPAEDNTAEGPRLIVIGSCDAAADAAFDNSGNQTLLMNSVNWLVKKETKLGIPPQRANSPMLNADPAAMKIIFYISIVGMPLLAALAGGFVWWFRRR